MNNTYTVHGVLAGAYKGKGASLKALLNHASADEGVTSLCKRVKADSLCDEVIELAELTCPHCIAKVAKL